MPGPQHDFTEDRTAGSERADAVIDEKLLHATIKLNTLLVAAISGLMAGLLLFCLTWLALLREPAAFDVFPNLLEVFLPGYSVTFRGAWIGLLWGGLIGAVLGAVTYRVYARSIRRQVTDYLAGGTSAPSLEGAVLKVYGHSLGLALGGISAAGLLFTTNWILALGAEEESVHASLLSHFLPGYSVSFRGSVIGALDTFVIAYLFCLLLGAVYNRVVERRRKGAVS